MFNQRNQKCFKKLTSSQMTIPIGAFVKIAACDLNVSYEMMSIGVGVRRPCWAMKVSKK